MAQREVGIKCNPVAEMRPGFLLGVRKLQNSEENAATDELPEIVYILINPSMPGLIKIGRTLDIEARVAQLSSSSSVPEPFVIAYAAYVEDSEFVERALHAAFSMHRMPGREFFRMPPTNATAALSLAEIGQVTLSSEVETPSPIVEEIRERGRRAGRKLNVTVMRWIEDFKRTHFRPPAGCEIGDAFPDLPKSTAYDYATRTRLSG